MKLAIITTHPIQYNAPWFKILSEKEGIEIKVFYTWSQRQTEFFDNNFGREIKWDIPLLDGYEYEFVENTSKKPGNKSFWGIKCPALIPRILKYSPTHILIFGWNFRAHFKVMRYFKGRIPVLFRGDSTLLDYNIQSLQDLFKFPIIQILSSSIPQLLKFQARKLSLSFIYRYINKALYVGTNNKAYFLKHGLKETQLCFVPHAVDNSRFFDGPEKDYTKKAFQWRRELGISDTDFVILFAGKFETKKAPLLLLEAFNRITEKQASVRLIFIGNGPMEEMLKEKAENNPAVIFLPFQNQSVMPVTYRLANLFCLPSGGPGETWGLAVNESIACGVPVITSNKVGCSPDLVKSPPCYQFQSGNVEDLSRVLKTAIAKNSNNPHKDWNSFINKWSYEMLTGNLLKVLGDEI